MSSSVSDDSSENKMSSTTTSVASSSGSTTLQSDDKVDAKDDKQKIDPLQNDWREFECNTWHLEPTVRLISWAGSQGQIEIKLFLPRLPAIHD